jgi:hypothetical protein
MLCDAPECAVAELVAAGAFEVDWEFDEVDSDAALLEVVASAAVVVLAGASEEVGAAGAEVDGDPFDSMLETMELIGTLMPKLSHSLAAKAYVLLASVALQLL